MALWRVRLRYPDGREEVRTFAAGNRDSARSRAEAAATRLGCVVEGDPIVVDPARGSL